MDPDETAPGLIVFACDIGTSLDDAKNLCQV